MKTCLKCGAQMPDNSLYCLNCGFANNQVCPECGKERAPGSTFCGYCGIQFFNSADWQQPQPTASELMPIQEIPMQSIQPMQSMQQPGGLAPYPGNGTMYPAEYQQYSAPPVPVAPAAPKKKIPIIPIVIGASALLIAGVVAIVLVVTTPSRKYKKAIKAFETGDYAAAAAQFEDISDYEDSADRAEEAKLLMHYTDGKKAYDAGDYEKAKEEFEACGNYKDSQTLAHEAETAAHYTKGVILCDSGNYDQALEELAKATGFKDYDQQILRCYYRMGEDAEAKNEYEKAAAAYAQAGDYQGASEKVPECYYKLAESNKSAGNLAEAVKNYALAGDFSDSKKQLQEIGYNLGKEALDRNDLYKAAEYLREAAMADYGDAKTIGLQAFYYKAQALINQKNYEEAAQYLRLCSGNKKATKLLTDAVGNLCIAGKSDLARQLLADYTGADSSLWGSYVDGLVAYVNKNYDGAASLFKKAGNFLNSKSYYNASRYGQAVRLLGDGSYAQARKIFASLGNYQYSKDLANVCSGETYYKAGKWQKAAAYYNKVSRKAVATGFNVQARKTHVVAKYNFIKASGYWTARSNIIYVRRVVGKSWRQWRAGNLWPYQYINLSYTQNPDGTFNLTGEVCYKRYYEYSFSDYYAPSKDTIYCTINLRNLKSFPTSIKLPTDRPSGYETLKYKNGVFTMVYARNVKSNGATLQYRSTVKYKK